MAWFGPFGMEIKGDVTLGVWALVMVYTNSARNALWLFSSFLGDRVGRPVGGGLGKFGFGIGSFFEVRKRGQVPVLTELMNRKQNKVRMYSCNTGIINYW